MAGRKRTSDSLKVIKGTDQPVRMTGNASGSIVISSVPLAPKHLNKEARKVWKSVATEMVNLRLLTTLNVMALAIYADLIAQYMKINSELDDTYLLKGKSVQLHPLLIAKNMVISQIMKLSTEFGFTPAAQSRIMGNLKATDEEQDQYNEL